ncbi:hypothetical protein [Streptomyces sp. NPDC056069]|uniref:hypothetical protein n=1 Tax=Streptomyces sp. NPDC056069 TaxID=3345702 RepID=UPI0035D912BE
MDRKQPFLVDLPERREDLWRQMSYFLHAWRDVPPLPLGLDDKVLTVMESNLGFRFPLALREFYGEFGALVGGFFDDGRNALLRPDQCRIADEFSGPLDSETLVIAEEYYGALWGVRRDEIDLADPPVRCIDTGGAEIDGLFSVTEFLVGLLFRSTVAHAPLYLRVECDLPEPGLAGIIHGNLLAHFQSWDRGNMEKECGFLSHIEGQGIIAALTEECLHLGLRGTASILTLPDPLPTLIAELDLRRT